MKIFECVETGERLYQVDGAPEVFTDLEDARDADLRVRVAAAIEEAREDRDVEDSAGDPIFWIRKNRDLILEVLGPTLAPPAMGAHNE